MAIVLTLIEVGDSTGIILPDEVLTRLGVKEGDDLCWVDIPEGVELRRCDEGVRSLAT